MSDPVRLRELADDLLSATGPELVDATRRAASLLRALAEEQEQVIDVVRRVEAASLPDSYSEHPDLVWRDDVIAALDGRRP